MARAREELDAPVLPQRWQKWPPAAVGGLLPEVERGVVAAAVVVVVVEAVVAEAVGLEAFQTLLLEV